MLRVITSLRAFLRARRGLTEERASTHLKLAVVIGLVAVLVAAVAVTLTLPHSEPDQRAWWVRVSPADGLATSNLDPQIDTDRVLSAAVEPSTTPQATPTRAPATATRSPDTPAPVAEAPRAPTAAPQTAAVPAAAPIPPVAPPTPAPTPTPPPGSSASGLAKQLIDLINSARASAGVPQLAIHGSLMASAEDYAAFHFLNADPFQLNHHLDGSLIDRLSKHGYTGAGGEALVTGPPDAQVLMDTWLNSPPHREILLSAQYVHLGVGCYQGPYTNADGYTFDAVALCVADLGYTV